MLHVLSPGELLKLVCIESARPYKQQEKECEDSFRGSKLNDQIRKQDKTKRSHRYNMF